MARIKNKEYAKITATKVEEFMELSEGERLARMDNILKYMNDQTAYTVDWTVNVYEEYKSVEDFMEISHDTYIEKVREFFDLYKEYHKEGMFAWNGKYPIQIVKDCKMFDKGLGLKEIEFLW